MSRAPSRVSEDSSTFLGSVIMKKCLALPIKVPWSHRGSLMLMLSDNSPDILIYFDSLGKWIYLRRAPTLPGQKGGSVPHIVWLAPLNNLVRVQAPLMEADLKIPPSSYEAIVHKLLSYFTSQQVLTNKGQILTYMQSTHHWTICNLVGKPIITCVKAPPSQGDIPTLKTWQKPTFPPWRSEGPVWKRWSLQQMQKSDSMMEMCVLWWATPNGNKLSGYCENADYSKFIVISFMSKFFLKKKQPINLIFKRCHVSFNHMLPFCFKWLLFYFINKLSN